MEENNKKKVGVVLPIILVIFVLGVLGSIVSNCSGGGGSNSSSYNPDNDHNAWICAQDIVEAKLKSPSTAKFPTYSSKYVSSLGNSKYKIQAYVDSQNGFGATIRTSFTVTLTLSGSGYKDGYCIFD